MPQKRPQTKDEELAALRTENAQQKKLIRWKDQELAEERAKRTQKSKRKLIPRPKGQAGRAKYGYNLQDEMGLADDPVRHQRLGRLVCSFGNQYLSAGKTIAKQDKTRLEKTIRLIQQEIKFFQRFQGAWPRDLRLEKLAEAEDSDDWSKPSRSKSAKPVDVGEDDQNEDENDEGYPNDWIKEDERDNDQNVTPQDEDE
ncbi:hypothetical protein C8R44DRAFT_885077 [Mycena epipterygia]|nr:hypothetical protein C8R44DRAFT_885077 [Mycena epipterygia]